MSTSVICPGSFDPPTLGHLDVFHRVAASFDRVVIAVVVNPDKAGTFTPEERLELIAASLGEHEHVELITFEGLLVDLCRDQGIRVVCKGLRTVGDFEYEHQMAQMNRHLAGVETVFLSSAPEHAHLSSSLIKQIAAAGGPLTGLVSPPVQAALQARYA
ncbi:MAG: pantetheine-phosphate adenylyltransferase [Nitriliruptoraceae bacterium]|nr:pantetheine-phosphate adenylyltransferase [Nitriliruptoraceae bacterium]